MMKGIGAEVLTSDGGSDEGQGPGRGQDQEQGQEQGQYEDVHVPKLHNPANGPTLLWSPLARLVSGATGVGSFYVRAGSRIGGWGVAAGREATLKSLEMSRAVVETILVAAGRDVSQRRAGELGRAEAENMLERSISALHTGISTASFIASSGFCLTQASIESFSALSIRGLSTLNAILGSTESSRAVAAIVTLIKDELNRPGSDGSDGTISYSDLLTGVVGFVFLQRWGRRKTEIAFRDAGGDETVWDTVIDDKGFRADVVGLRKKDEITTSRDGTNGLLYEDSEDCAILDTDLDIGAATTNVSSEDPSQLTDDEIRARILSQLPEGTRATITSETLTLKTITVDIHSPETAQVEPPPGLTMVSEHLSHEPNKDHGDASHQTIVFRTALRRSSSAEIESTDRLRLTQGQDTDLDSVDNDEVVMMQPKPGGRSVPGSSRTSFENYLSRSNDGRLFESPPVQSPRGPVANQKKSRKPVLEQNALPLSVRLSKLPVPKNSPEKLNASNKGEKPGIVKKAFKTLNSSIPSSSSAQDQLTTLSKHDRSHREASADLSRSLRRDDTSKKIFPMPARASRSTPLTSPKIKGSSRRDGTATNYFAVHEQRRESTVSQTDTYSIHSSESRPGSPTIQRSHTIAVNGLTKTKSQTEISVSGSPHHRRSKSVVPSLYSMSTKHSEEAIILASKTPVPRRSIFEDHDMLLALSRDGKVPGTFPNRHLVTTVRRFARFASASYGPSFLRVMGLSPEEKKIGKSTEVMNLDVHAEHSSFSSYTGLPADTILLSSFFDPKGVSGNLNWSSAAFSPLIHFISIDHDSKAVVLTCRGTLGFEDVLTDMTCGYDDIYWQGQPYKIHKGIHAAARRLFHAGNGSRVLATIKATLEEFPDFGLVLCGHSLGGAVAAVLAVLISEPSETINTTADDNSTSAGNFSFVIAAKPTLIANAAYDASSTTIVPTISLPSGRPIHVYAYGTPATISEPLRLATRGLITTVINANDIVPCLSLGTLHDFRAIARHLKTDTQETIVKLRGRVFERVKRAIQSAFYMDKSSGPPPPENLAGDGLGEDVWAWKELVRLRALMTNEKLVPPGEVFVLETTRVFDRLDADSVEQVAAAAATAMPAGVEKGRVGYHALGRPATRVRFKLVRDVQGRFAELRFGRNMFGDHSPGRYEAGLAALEKGVCED